MGSSSGPQPLGQALSDLIALRGLAASRGRARLEEAWKTVAGPKIAGRTRVLGLKRGTLQIGVTSSALLSELAAFHQPSLLRVLRRDHGDLGIENLKFRLAAEAPRDVD